MIRINDWRSPESGEKAGRFVFDGGLDAKKIPNYEQKFWQNHLKANLIDMFTPEISITDNKG